MCRIDLVKQAMDEQLDNSYDLLALRILFPPDSVVVKIEQEIRDLYVYPERLETSYRDEWRSIVARALIRNAFTDHWRTDQENLNRYLAYLRDHAIPRCVHDNIGVFRMLGEVLAISESENALVFPDPRRQALVKMIWPEKAGR